jgi:drug/metabolite transporter (DMT)-like permease
MDFPLDHRPFTLPARRRWRRLSPNAQGAFWMILAGTGFTLNGLLVKTLSAGGMDPFQTSLARVFFALVALAPFIWRVGPAAFKTNHPVIHLLRGFVGGAAMLFGFYGLAHLPLATVTALGFTQPLFTIILAVLILSEPVRWRRWAATAVGFLGVLVMLRPGSGSFEPVLLAPLAMAFCIAVAVVLVKRLPASESQTAMLVYFCVASFLLALVPAILHWRDPTPLEWLLLAGVGVLGMISQACILRAYRAGEATFVAPFDYSKLLLATIVGYLFFAEVPDVWTWGGAAIIIASTYYIVWRERVRKTERRRPGVRPL